MRLKLEHANKLSELSEKLNITRELVLEKILDKEFENFEFVLFRAGTKWTNQEKQLLIDRFNSNARYDIIAKSLYRTERSITTKLQQLGLLFYDSFNRTLIRKPRNINARTN